MVHKIDENTMRFRRWIPFTGAYNREEKSLRNVAMETKLLGDNKPKKSLKSLFALFQTSPILFSVI